MQNFSNCNDSSSETCLVTSFSEVHLSGKSGKITNTCNLTTPTVSLFSLFLFLLIFTILLHLKRDLYEHFYGN